MPLAKVNKAQLQALHTVFKFDPSSDYVMETDDPTQQHRFTSTAKWREFRKSVQASIPVGDYVMVYWAGMWLGIEKDGYTHS